MAKRRGKKKAGGPRRPSRTEEAAPAMTTVVLPPLPDVLVEDILLRLPPKSLAASRCVSPSWNRLVSSAAFAGLHHAAAAGRAGAAPRFVSVPVKPDWHSHLRVASPRETSPGAYVCEDCPRVFCGPGKACRGLVLVGRPCEGSFYACNPSTGGALRLPPRLPPWYLHSAGLGYDAAGAGTHKAVLLERVAGHPPPRWSIPRLLCCVAAVGAGGQWRWRAPRGRRTPIICEGAHVSSRTDPVFAGGHLHWMLTAPAADGAHGEPNGVLSFTLTGESFLRLPLPAFASASEPSAENRPPVHATLAELDGRLGLVRDLRCPRRAAALFEVWLLRDYESLAWSLDRRVDLTPHVGKDFMWPWCGDLFVLGYVGGESSGERRKMLLATTAQVAYMYDPDAGDLRTVARRRKGGAPQYMRLVLYQESIVQMAGMEYGKEDIKFKFVPDNKRASESSMAVILLDD